LGKTGEAQKMTLKSNILTLTAVIMLAGCLQTTAPVSQPVETPVLSQSSEAIHRYDRVVARMEPITEAACSRQTRAGTQCDFLIMLDDDPAKGINAYQTLDDTGRPILAFTIGILKAFQNDDELAFVLGHEAAHHIEGHIAKTVETATIGAVIGGGLATIFGGGQTAVDIATDLGGTVGARTYSKAHELEADALGAVLTERAGYSAVRGAQFFERLPDPGNRFLGTHPPNEDRIATVRATVAGL
jgi:predicted Zn-dependent protease